jgi:D-serine dehydratase
VRYLAAVSRLDKGVGAAATEGRWNLLAEDLSLPAAVLLQERLEHNLRWMQSFIDAYGVKLAPHGKTTMAPRLFQRQIAAGAWGITVATASQAQVAFDHGIARVLMANVLVGRRNLEIVAEMMSSGGLEFFCLVDSPEAVAHLGRFFRPRGQRIHVLLELGPAGGRTGARDTVHEEATLHAVDDWRDAVTLAGIEVYEGVLKAQGEIRGFLQRAADVAHTLLREGRLHRRPPILSGAGSAWYDVVAEELHSEIQDFDVVLRPGCYLTHDVGAYREAQTRILAQNAVARRLGTGLEPALQIWAYVLSRPEPARAILGFGKRDAAFDAGYPTPALIFRPARDARPESTPPHWRISGMMDQHAYLDVDADDDVRVGDMLGFDISHPCLTFDKWRRISVVDADYRVVEVVETYF